MKVFIMVTKQLIEPTQVLSNILIDKVITDKCLRILSSSSRNCFSTVKDENIDNITPDFLIKQVEQSNYFFLQCHRDDQKKNNII